MKERIAELLTDSLNTLKTEGIVPDELQRIPQVERTRDASHGDMASNLAMTLAKPCGRNPRELAQLLIQNLPATTEIDKVEIAGPGFINFFLSQASQQQLIQQIIEAGERFGTNNSGNGQPLQVEFVSANPTGPLHIGHGRGAAIGDSICRILTANGWKVTREFYYNDAGQQINNLAHSVQSRARGMTPEDHGWPEDGYRGEYIKDIADAYLNRDTVDAADQHVEAKGDAEDMDAIRHFAVAYLRHEQDLDLKSFDVAFDCFYLESSLYADGKVEETVQRLVKNGFTYEKEGALWLKTTEFGDDKDRVMRKSDGGYTYFVPDVAYHINKWERGFTRVINEQGADHHSTITRVRAGLQAADVGIPSGWPDYVLHQMVTVMRNGEEVKISKRAGSYVTLRDLIDEVGRDATRFFLVARAPTSQLTFDIDLALSQSNENPVYYIQYAHARTASVFRKLLAEGLEWDRKSAESSLSLLTEPLEHAVIARLSAYPEVITNAARDMEPHQVANFLKELASDFHTCYNAHKMLTEDEALRNARLSLCLAVQIVLRNGLGLLGVSAPDEM